MQHYLQASLVELRARDRLPIGFAELVALIHEALVHPLGGPGDTMPVVTRPLYVIVSHWVTPVGQNLCARPCCECAAVSVAQGGGGGADDMQVCTAATSPESRSEPESESEPELCKSSESHTCTSLLGGLIGSSRTESRSIVMRRDLRHGC